MEIPIGIFRSIRIRAGFARAVQTLARITQTQPAQVVSDALKLYEWILREQTNHRIIASLDAGGAVEAKLASFVVDKGSAVQYFSASAEIASLAHSESPEGQRASESVKTTSTGSST